MTQILIQQSYRDKHYLLCALGKYYFIDTMRLPEFSINFLGRLVFNLALGFLFNYSLGWFRFLTEPLFVMASLAGLAFLLNLPATGSLGPAAVQLEARYALAAKFLLLLCTMWFAEIVCRAIPIFLDAGFVLVSILVISIGLMGLVVLGLLEVFGAEC